MGTFSSKRGEAVKLNIINQVLVRIINTTDSFRMICTGWLRIKYPTRQYAISPQKFQKFLKLLNPDTSVNLTLYNISTAPWLYNHTTA